MKLSRSGLIYAYVDRLPLRGVAADRFEQNDRSTSAETPSSFFNPASRYRSRFRYWIPDASVDVERVRRDIASVGRYGGGGIELLPYYMNGLAKDGLTRLRLPVLVDWTN